MASGPVPTAVPDADPGYTFRARSNIVVVDAIVVSHPNPALVSRMRVALQAQA
jgi:hypothetical protein